MAHKYHDIILTWLDGKVIQQYNRHTSAWEDWEYNFDCTPPFASGEWRIKPKKSPVEEAGITKEDLLAYFDKDCDKTRNGLILRVKHDDGTGIPECKVVVGNRFFTKGDLLWCDLSNMKKIFP